MIYRGISYIFIPMITLKEVWSMSYLKECILFAFERAGGLMEEIEAFLTLEAYFSAPEAKILIDFDPEENAVYETTQKYLKAYRLTKEAYADLRRKNSAQAEEKFTQAIQILSEIGFTNGLLTQFIDSGLTQIPAKEEALQ